MQQPGDAYQILKKNPHAVDTRGRSYLFIACFYGHHPLVRHALKCGANPNYYAIPKSNSVKVNSKRGFGTDVVPNFPLFGAVYKNHPKIVNLLLQEGARVDITNHFNETPLFYAVRFQHHEIIKILFDAGANPYHKNKRGDCPFTYMIEYGFSNTLSFFIENGGNVAAYDKEGPSAVHIALEKRMHHCLKLILDTGVNPTANGKVGHPYLLTAIHPPFDLTSVKLLLDAGADPNYTGAIGTPPLLYAAISEKFSCFGPLLKAGANPNVHTRDGEYPLTFACRNGLSDTIAVLLSSGAKHDIYTEPSLNYDSLLTLAAYDYRTFQILIAAGVDLDHQNRDGITALMDVVDAGYYRIAVLLLAAGADPNIQNDAGESALSIAKTLKHDSIAEVLETVVLPLQSLCICQIQLQELREIHNLPQRNLKY